MVKDKKYHNFDKHEGYFYVTNPVLYEMYNDDDDMTYYTQDYYVSAVFDGINLYYKYPFFTPTEAQAFASLLQDETISFSAEDWEKGVLKNVFVPNEYISEH